MKKEIIITDISAVALEKNALSEEITQNKWKIMPYETANRKGKLVWAGLDCTPAPLTLPLNATGKYHVYLGTVNVGGETTTSVRFSNEKGKTQVCALGWLCWQPTEWFEENYFITLDLTGQSLIVSKPQKDNVQSALAWIRLVPVENENIENKCMAYHFDTDYYSEDKYESLGDYLGRMKVLAGGGMELMLHEKTPAYDVAAIDWEKASKREKAQRFPKENQAKIDEALIACAREMNSKIYASFRIEAGGFVFPSHDIMELYNDKYFYNKKEWLCKTRDGRSFGVCSYTYPEVRKRIIDMLINGVGDYDGLSLFFHRGTFVAFEQPIVDMVYERYGVDARRLPFSDPRLHEVFCHFVTLFMRELRAELDKLSGKRKEINVFVFYTAADSKHYGFDVETWINEGLIDSVSQGLMTIFEDLDGCMADDGLIDLEKYKKANGERFMILREAAANEKLILQGVEEFKRICGDKVTFYATLAWQNADPDFVKGLVDKIKAVGVTKFVSWNTNHKAKFLRRLNAEKFYATGNQELYEERKVRYERTMSIDGTDISQYSPNWKG